MATTDTPDPTVAPQPAADDDAPTPPSPPNGAEVRAFLGAMQDAEKAVADAVRNMGEPQGG